MKYRFINMLFAVVLSLLNKQVYTAWTDITVGLKTTGTIIGQKLEQWFEAAENNNLSVVKNLANTVDVNVVDEYGNSALILAAREGHLEICKFLLSIEGIRINGQNPFADTALICAAYNGHENVVKLLLQRPDINVNIQNKLGSSALLSAAEGGFDAFNNIVKLLLEVPGININARHKNGYTIYELANNFRRPLIAQIVKQKLDELTNQAFGAIKENDLGILKSILAQIGVDTIFDGTGQTLLDVAFEHKRTKMIEYLLQKAKDPIELLARFPFEKLNPTSELFKYFLELPFRAQLKVTGDKEKWAKNEKT